MLFPSRIRLRFHHLLLYCERLMSQINGPPPPVPRSVLRRIALLTAIISISNLAASIQKGSRVFLFQQTQCFNYYQIHDPGKIGWNEMIDEALCKGDGVQHPLSYTVGIDSLLATLPGIDPHCSADVTASSNMIPFDLECLSGQALIVFA